VLVGTTEYTYGHRGPACGDMRWGLEPRNLKRAEYRVRPFFATDILSLDRGRPVYLNRERELVNSGAPRELSFDSSSARRVSQESNLPKTSGNQS